MPTPHDKSIQQLIDTAKRSTSVSRALASLDRVREQVMVERGPDDPALGALWDAQYHLSNRRPDPEPRLKYAEGRAVWFKRVHGPDGLETLRALSDLGDEADQDCAWPVAIAAWEQICAAPLPHDATDADKRRVGKALRGLGARHLAAGRNDRALDLFERELELQEAMGARGRELALSLKTVASVLEDTGATARAAELEERRLRVLRELYGEDHGQVAELTKRVEALRAMGPD